MGARPVSPKARRGLQFLPPPAATGSTRVGNPPFPPRTNCTRQAACTSPRQQWWPPPGWGAQAAPSRRGDAPRCRRGQAKAPLPDGGCWRAHRFARQGLFGSPAEQKHKPSQIVVVLLGFMFSEPIGPSGISRDCKVTYAPLTRLLTQRDSYLRAPPVHLCTCGAVWANFAHPYREPWWRTLTLWRPKSANVSKIGKSLKVPGFPARHYSIACMCAINYWRRNRVNTCAAYLQC